MARTVTFFRRSTELDNPSQKLPEGKLVFCISRAGRIDSVVILKAAMRWGSSSGLPVIVLAPVDVADCYRLTVHVEVHVTHNRQVKPGGSDNDIRFQ